MNKEGNCLCLSWLTDIAGVSRSGYYAWVDSEKERWLKEVQDRIDFLLILEAYNYKGYKKGWRSIYMRLLHSGITMNHKKIQRLMRKYGLFCPIRKPNPYKKMLKASHEARTAPNLIQRQFKSFGPRMVLLTDITYMYYGQGNRCYLSVIKDAFTNEVLAYMPSLSLHLNFVLETIEQMMERHGDELSDKTMVHSDQGTHYTSIQFSKLLKDNNLLQSMSRRANCWDNAPQESFFGHMKDEIGDKISACRSFKEVCACIDGWMKYYNEERYQWDLAKLSPNQYYKYCMTGEYPLKRKERSKEKK